jgi:nucleotide-binding universal stress UspA family protein
MTMHLLVATDGTDAALAALRLARALSRQRAATVEVLSVVPSLPPPPARIDGTPREPSEIEQRTLDSMRATIERQLAGLGESTARWPIAVRMGGAAETIALTARDARASLILVGRHHRERAEPAIGVETVLDVVHLAHLPVIAVDRGLARLPRRVLIGVDIHAPELDSAPTLALQVADPSTIHLGHVAWEVGPTGRGGLEPWKEEFLSRVTTELETLAAQLRQSTHAQVEVHVPTGDWDLGLLALADRLDVDLIATGSHAYGALGRAFTRSVSTAVLRGAACSVLIAPTTTVSPSPDTPDPADVPRTSLP